MSCERPDQLSFAEVEEIVAAGVRLGIRKIRITGGEPLVRPGLVEFIRALGRLPGISDLALSTNGTLLAEHAARSRTPGSGGST